MPSVREHMTNSSAETFVQMSSENLYHLFIILDFVFFGYFLIETTWRFLLCPNKIKWLKNIINIIDILSLVLFFVFYGISFVNDQPIITYLRRLAESLRVFLFYKLTDLNWRFKTIGISFKRSYRELILALFYILLSLLVISTCMFYAEVRSNKSFNSIPAVFWWTMVTMTTVGFNIIMLFLLFN